MYVRVYFLGFFLLNVSVYMNLPICVVAFGVLYVSLRHVQLGNASNASWRSFIQTFDFLGL